MNEKYMKLLQEIRDYFNKVKDEDYMIFDGHPLSSAEDLMDNSKPAPWDHLTNTDDDDDIDIDIKENIYK